MDRDVSEQEPPYTPPTVVDLGTLDALTQGAGALNTDGFDAGSQ